MPPMLVDEGCTSTDLMFSDWNERSTAQMIKECTICGAPSNGYHFNAPSCSACAAFFRRTVTLNRNFSCSQQGNCRVNFAMRVICRACRYVKCIRMGMERAAVQPRRDCNVGRRKIMYRGMKQPKGEVFSQPHNQSNQVHVSPSLQFHDDPPKPIASAHHPMDVLSVAMDSSGLSPEINYAQSYSSSISEDLVPSPRYSFSSHFSPRELEAEQLLEDLLREERLVNERRKLLYCGHSSISNLLTTENVNDIPFTPEDLHPLTFEGIQKHIRPQILVIYEWLRGWRHFQLLNTHDRLIFLRRCVLYHTILDPAYLSVRLGLPDRFVMFNGMYVGATEDDKTGWEDEGTYISGELKNKLYRPLMRRVINEICASMRAVELSFVEFVLLKALISFKSICCSDISPSLKKFMNAHLDVLLKALNVHYTNIGLSREEMAERTGNVVLMMSSIFAVGMECLESHHKIQFFDLWQLDDLLMKLIRREL